MPLEHRIDHRLRVVFTRATGTLTDDEVFTYQQDVWSRPEVAGYDELIDMSDVEHVAVPSPDRIVRLASVSAGMDVTEPVTRLAIVAPHDFEFGLGRMYGAHRDMDSRSTKRVGVFRTRPEALAWLGLDRKSPGET
jgi:hypothetical protein